MADSTALPATEEQSASGATQDDNNAELMRQIKRWFRRDRAHWGEWYKQAEEDFAFVAGEQWDPKDVQTLKDASRPVITFNRIDPLIRSVSGEQINNAQEVRYLPREMGDAQVNEALTSVAEWFRDQCDADDEESDGFWDAAVCGVGCTDTVVNTDDPDEPMPETERLDPLEVMVDADARKRNFSDARRVWRIRKMARSAARALAPDQADSDLDATWARLDTEDGSPELITVDKYNDDDKEKPEAADEQVTVVQIQWWEREAYYRTLDPATGQSVDVPPDQFARLEQRMQELGTPLQGIRLERRVYKQALIGRAILKLSKPPSGDAFSFNFITGFRDRNNGTFYGLVRAMKDPQRWANKWLSQTLHIMNVNAKGGVMIEQGAIDKPREFEATFAKPQDITWVPDGTLSSPNGAKIQPKPAAQFPAGFYQLMTFAISSVRDVAGVNLEMLGMREADQAASLEYQRRQAGVAILAPLFRSMRRYHRNHGKVLLYYIQNVLNPQQLVRVLGDNGNKQYQPLQAVIAMKGASAKYDIVVDEGPTSPNQKERVWALATPLFAGLPPAIQMALLEYSPLPVSVVEKIKQAAKEAAQSPQAAMAQQMAQLKTMLIEAQVLLTKAKAGQAQADAAKTASEIGQSPQNDTGTDPTKLLADAALAKHKTDTQAQVDLTRIAADRQAAQDKIIADQQTNAAWMTADSTKAATTAHINARAAVAKALIGSRKPQTNTGPTSNG